MGIMSTNLYTLVWVPAAWLSIEIYRRTAARFGEYKSVLVEQPTVQMRPGSNDMHEDISHTRDIILSQLNLGRDVILMAHSAGGFVSALAAQGLTKNERQNYGHSNGVIGIIGVAVQFPYPGNTLVDMNVEYGMNQQEELATKLEMPRFPYAEYISGFKMNEASRMRYKRARLYHALSYTAVNTKDGQDVTNECMESERHFYSDLDRDQAQYWISKQGTASTAYVSSASHGRPFLIRGPEHPITENIPSYFIYTARDQAMLYGVREEYAKYFSARRIDRVLKINSDHVPHISHPEELEKVLRTALNGIKEAN